MSYQPLVYREQGGSSLVVASGGSIANSGTITNSSAGTIVDSVTAETTGATLTNYGVSLCANSTAYTLAVPAAGCLKTIGATTGTTSALITSSTLAKIGAAGVAITLGDASACITLRGVSATKWLVVGKTTGAVIS